MSTFTLAISCLTTSNLPWFMGLTFQVPMQYCSLQHWTFSPSPVTSTTGHCFSFGSISSFFLELLFLYSFPVAYWASSNLGISSFSVVSFCLSLLFTGFSRQEYWSGLPFPSPGTGDWFRYSMFSYNTIRVHLPFPKSCYTALQLPANSPVALLDYELLKGTESDLYIMIFLEWRIVPNT